MTKKWIAINILLLVTAVLLARQLHTSILRFNAENDLRKIQPAKDMKQAIVQEKPLAPPPAAKAYVPADFALIPEKNIFSESRGPEEKAEAAAPPETPPLTQKPILVGVTILDNQPRALIIDPAGPPQDRSRRAQTKRIGDVYRGYSITEISLDRIVLESGTRREIIPLHEGSKKTPPGKTSILSTRVVPFGGGGVSGGTPVSVAGGSGGATPRTTVAPVTSSTAQPPATAAQPAAGQARSPATSPSTAQPAAPAKGTPGTGTGTRTLRTPFGDIVRPNRN